MISRIVVRLRYWRRLMSRTHWAARLLGIRTPAGEAEQPGLLILQIDGLSRCEMERALASGRLPFLARLIQRRHFTLESFYSGVPSTTAAVQAELFYGVRTAVPSFGFLRRSAGVIFRMNEARAAADIEADLEQQQPAPLLQDGHAYSNIFRGGAVRSRYCAQDMAPDTFVHRLRPFTGLLLAVLYAPKILRMAGLALMEFGIAIIDMFKGFYQREDFFKELAFVPSRVLVCIILREMIRFRVLLDIESGVQVVHANFLGYDEQAHRRGPDSAFAHWTLKGIDSAIRDIYHAAEGCTYRDYECIIHSDHGQEHGVPYARKFNRELEAALREVFATGPLAGTKCVSSRDVSLLGMTATSANAPDPANQIVLTALGPIGHLYVPGLLPAAEMAAYARQIVAAAGVPLVLQRHADGTVDAFNSRGVWSLPADHAQVIGRQHPFPEEAAADLVSLCTHTDAGELILSGWDPQQPPLTFAAENGAHGGPGANETHGFLLVPDRIQRWHVAHLRKTGERVRGEDLRQIALHFLGREGSRVECVPHYFPRRQDLPIRVMTYNVHSCIGIDGKARPERIARVINYCDPDVVALQEVDAHRVRSGGYDQSQTIADHLRMDHVFHAMFEEEKERYGIALFSWHPFEIVKADYLTPAQRRPHREARGAIWVRLVIPGRRPLHIINTHFGLGRSERRQQVEQLLGNQWLGAIPADEPIILCGDFNSGPRSVVMRRLQARLIDTQVAVSNHTPRATFPPVKPLLRIDHVLVSPHFAVASVELPDSPTARVASDHLPLTVELQLHPGNEAA